MTDRKFTPGKWYVFEAFKIERTDQSSVFSQTNLGVIDSQDVLAGPFNSEQEAVDWKNENSRNDGDVRQFSGN